MSLEKADLIAALSQLSPDERNALMGASSVAPKGTPKFSPAIDAIADTDVDGAIAALTAVLKTSGDHDAVRGAINALASKFPGLAAAAQSNSSYRGKSIWHSCQVALTRLTMRKAD